MTHQLLGLGTGWMVVPLIRRKNAGGKTFGGERAGKMMRSV